MVMKIGVRDITVDYYLHDVYQESQIIRKEVRKYKNGRTVVTYGPILEVTEDDRGMFHARVDRIDLSHLVGTGTTLDETMPPLFKCLEKLFGG